MPPKSSVKPVWTIEGFGAGQSAATAAIHFGDTKTQESLEEETPGTPATTKTTPVMTKSASATVKTNGAKSAAAKLPAKKNVKAAAPAARKARG
jgi:hypothetical protein